MFLELFPLLEKRTVMITLAAVGDGRIRANVIPARAKDDEAADAALSAPLTMVGTPAEMDERFPAELAQFTDSAVQTTSTLNELKAQHKAAVHALEEENKKKLAEKKKIAGGKSVAAEPESAKPGPEFKDGKPVFGTKAGTTTAPAVQSLFDNTPAANTRPTSDTGAEWAASAGSLDGEGQKRQQEEVEEEEEEEV